MFQAESIYEEVCPNCGDYVIELDDATGWCVTCTGGTLTRYCRVCSQKLNGAYRGNTICSHCKNIEWLTRNGDAIENAMATYGISAGKAKRFVALANRPTCHLCGKPIKGGSKGKSFFCTTTEACAKASGVYQYHRHDARRSHEAALNRAMTAGYTVILTQKVIHFE